VSGVYASGRGLALAAAEAVSAAYPRLLRIQPSQIGASGPSALADVRLDPARQALYQWEGYHIEVRVGEPDHLDDDLEDQVLRRLVVAHATLVAPDFHGADVRDYGHVEATVDVPLTVMYPRAVALACRDLDDPRLHACVLATVGRALDHMRIATDYAARILADGLHSAETERTRPDGVDRGVWRKLADLQPYDEYLRRQRRQDGEQG